MSCDLHGRIFDRLAPTAGSAMRHWHRLRRQRDAAPLARQARAVTSPQVAQPNWTYLRSVATASNLGAGPAVLTGRLLLRRSRPAHAICRRGRKGLE